MPGVALSKLLKDTDFPTSSPTEFVLFLVLRSINIGPIVFTLCG